MISKSIYKFFGPIGGLPGIDDDDEEVDDIAEKYRPPEAMIPFEMTLDYLGDNIENKNFAVIVPLLRRLFVMGTDNQCTLTMLVCQKSEKKVLVYAHLVCSYLVNHIQSKWPEESEKVCLK